MANGTVKWVNSTKGFGTIAPEQGANDVFLHVSAVEGAGLRDIKDGQKVTFNIERGRDGREPITELQLVQARSVGHMSMVSILARRVYPSAIADTAFRRVNAPDGLV